ncbi:hypothetical protein AVEN_56796-1 [Araneus ventricosus]|uniref:RNA-directed DNA polymerase from transposon X-element n=1 Tax=Araneus ventricosus TaxID=182803 RepID=A0A4Y2HAP1_ARAVE|nr:hypothetical protein AVEN_56796-1 [Araneus ventricosus]
MEVSGGVTQDDYTRLSIDANNHSKYSNEDLIKILSPETFYRADIQVSIAPPEINSNMICERILYLDRLRKAANSKLALYERLNNSNVLPWRTNLNEYLDRNHIFAALEHVVRKAQDELTRISACPVTNCSKHSAKLLSPTSVLVKNTPKINPPKARQRNFEEFETVRYKNKAKRDWQNTRNPAFNKFKKELYHSEWKDKLIALQPSDNSLWGTAERMRRKHNKISALKFPTSIAFSNTDKAEIIADSLQNQFTLNNLTDTATENLVSHFINEFNLDNFPPLPTPKPTDIIKHIRKVNIHKAPGSDGITNNMLRNLSIITLIKIIHIINNIFKLHYFPISWRVGIVVPVLKPGKALLILLITDQFHYSPH